MESGISPKYFEKLEWSTPTDSPTKRDTETDTEDKGIKMLVLKKDKHILMRKQTIFKIMDKLEIVVFRKQIHHVK